jgi:hypothetical protein
MRIALAVFLLAHGIAHIVGFLGAWAPTRTTIIGNRIDLGPGWIKIVGLGWLLGALGFGAAAVSAALGIPWWPSLALGLALGSLALCLLQLPETKFGVILNLVLVVVLLTRF